MHIRQGVLLLEQQLATRRHGETKREKALQDTYCLGSRPGRVWRSGLGRGMHAKPFIDESAGGMPQRSLIRNQQLRGIPKPITTTAVISECGAAVWYCPMYVSGPD